MPEFSPGIKPSYTGNYLCYITFMGQDYKKLLKKKKKKYCDINTMGLNIDKNEYFEIIMSNSANPGIFENNNSK